MHNQKIYILSDKKGIGKTTSLQKWIESKSYLKGFLSPLVEGKRMFQIIETQEFIPMETKSKDLKIGKYLFDQKSFDKVEQIVLNTFLAGTKDTIILDEIGPLEINKNLGFHNLVLRLINTRKEYKSNLLFVVRQSCLKDFINKYKLSDYEIFNLDKFNHKYLNNN
jgi:nucleoside-triphosphatase THEP1